MSVLRTATVMLSVAIVGCSSLSVPEQFVNAAIEGRPNEVRTHIADGIDIELMLPVDSYRKTPLLWACTLAHSYPSGDHEGVVMALLEAGADINAVDAHGDGAISGAAMYGQSGLVSLLLEHGADINHRGRNGYTPLMSAARAGQLEVVELLIEQGADLTLRNSDGKTASELSAGHENVASVLAKAAEAA